MSESTSTLNVNIKATNSATSQIKTLETEIKSLQKTLAELQLYANQAANSQSAGFQKTAASIQKEISSVQGLISAKQQQIQTISNTVLLIERENAALAKQLALMDSLAASKAARAAALAIPAAPVATAAAAAAPLGVPAFLAAQRNAQGEFAATEKAATRTASGIGRAMSNAGVATVGYSSILQRESRHIVGVFDSMARGQSGAAFSSLGAGLRDAGVGASALTIGIAGMAGVMGTAAILHHTEALGKMVTETRAAARAAGMSLPAYSQLQGAMTLMGLKAEDANASLRHLSGSVGNALANPASLTARAFHNLGISQEALKSTGGDAEKSLQLLVAAFNQTQDSVTKTDNMRQILGDGFQKLIPILQAGSSGLEQYKKKATELGIALDEHTANKLEEAGQKVDELSAKIKGQGIQAFAAWAPVIEQVAEALGGLITILGNAVTGVGKLREAMNGFDIPEPLKNAIRLLPMFGPAGVLLGGANSGATSAAANAAKGVDLGHGEYGPTQPLRAVPGLVRGGGGGGNKNQPYLDFASQEQLAISEADGNIEKITQIYDEWIKAAKEKFHQTDAVIAKIIRRKIEAINKAKLSDIRDSAQETDQLSKLMQIESQLNEYKAGRGFRGQKTGWGEDIRQSQRYTAQAQEVEARAAPEIAVLHDIASTAEAGSNAQKAAQKELLSVVLRTKEQEMALYKKAGDAAQSAVNKMMEPFTHFFSSVGSRFENFFDSVLTSVISPGTEKIKAGLTTITRSLSGTNIATAAKSLLTGVVSDFGKMVQSALSKTIANIVSNGASNSISELISNWVSKGLSNVFSSIAGNTIGNVAGSALGNAAGSAASSAASSAAIVTAITSAATIQETTMATGFASIVASIEALTALTAATSVSVLGFSLSGGGVLPSAAGGMVVGGLNSNGGGYLSILHAKEMVLPAHISTGLQNVISNGGLNKQGQQSGGVNSVVNNLNYSPSVNTSSRSRSGTGMSRAEFSQMMANHSAGMMGEARNMMRSGWRPAF